MRFLLCLTPNLGYDTSRSYYRAPGRCSYRKICGFSTFRELLAVVHSLALSPLGNPAAQTLREVKNSRSCYICQSYYSQLALDVKVRKNIG
jgi:hypothetical protein